LRMMRWHAREWTLRCTTAVPNRWPLEEKRNRKTRDAARKEKSAWKVKVRFAQRMAEKSFVPTLIDG